MEVEIFYILHDMCYQHTRIFIRLFPNVQFQYTLRVTFWVPHTNKFKSLGYQKYVSAH